MTAAARATTDAGVREPTRDRTRRISQLAWVLDNSIRLPIIGRRIGIDGLIGLIPGVGDAATGALSAYLIVEAARAGVRKRALARMAGNAAIDTVIGSIPLVGDLFDMGFKANARNARIALDEIARRERETAEKETEHA